MRKAEIIKQLHPFVRPDPLVNEIAGAVGGKLDSFDAQMEDFRQQLDIDTATWGLVVYEKELDIQTDISKPLAERRSIIKGRIRGAGKIGAPEIKLICDSWTNGNVDVEFNGTIIITFTSVYGIPEGLGSLKSELRKATPAHLALQYIFRYYLYSELANSGLTYSGLAATGKTYNGLLNGGI
ncbi:hypothetical protein D3C75_850410 [compost metagenome]